MFSQQKRCHSLILQKSYLPEIGWRALKYRLVICYFVNVIFNTHIMASSSSFCCHFNERLEHTCFSEWKSKHSLHSKLNHENINHRITEDLACLLIYIKTLKQKKRSNLRLCTRLQTTWYVAPPSWSWRNYSK